MHILVLYFTIICEPIAMKIGTLIDFVYVDNFVEFDYDQFQG